MRASDVNVVLLSILLCVSGHVSEITSNELTAEHSLELTQSMNLARQELIQESCQRFYPRWTVENLPDNQFEHVLVDETHKLLYCYVPKVSVKVSQMWCD